MIIHYNFSTICTLLMKEEEQQQEQENYKWKENRERERGKKGTRAHTNLRDGGVSSQLL